MKRLVTAAQMRAVDAASSDQHGMPSSVLMENAGGALADAALGLAAPTGRFIVLCGRGNSGGDGLVAARKLLALGRTVIVEVMGGADRLDGEPKRNLLALRSAGLDPARVATVSAGPGDVIIDALFGTGLARPPRGEYADAIERIGAWRRAGAKVLAADLPSGLQSDSGQPFEPCVEADLTLSFGLIKVGQALEPGRSLSGEVREAEIGIPRAAIEAVLGGPAMWLLEEGDVRGRVPVRRSDTHKGTYGHVLVIAGSRGKTGAAALAGIAALRAGAGLVTVATRPEALPHVMAHAPELMGAELAAGDALGLPDLAALIDAADKKTALVMGPGIPRGPGTASLIGALLEQLELPAVLDADALNAIAEQPGVLQRAKGPVILTPHPGEMARLAGRSTAEVQRDRVGVTREVASARRAIVLLKGAATLVGLPDGTVYVNPTGNPGMATGGTGDVLSGMIGGLLAQGLGPEDAALTGVFAHGLAADLAAKRTGRQGLIATDLLPGLCEVWTRWGR